MIIFLGPSITQIENFLSVIEKVMFNDLNLQTKKNFFFLIVVKGSFSSLWRNGSSILEEIQQCEKETSEDYEWTNVNIEL